MKMTVLVALVTGLLLGTLVGSTPAGGCVRVRAATSTTQHYQQQNYQAANVQYHQQQNYDYHAVVVPKVVKVIAHEDYHYSLSDGYRDSVLADAIAFRILSVQGGLGGGAQGPRPNGDPAPQGFPPPPNAGPVPRVPKPPPNAGLKTSVPDGLHEVVDAKCLKCHTDANGLILLDLPSVPEGKRWKAYAMVNTGDMPKGGTPIPDAEVKLFYDWAKAK